VPELRGRSAGEPPGPAAGSLSRGAAPARIASALSAAVTSSPEGFPPQDLRSFLELCAGEWLALRSHFDLGLVEPGEAAAASGPTAPGATAPEITDSETTDSETTASEITAPDTTASGMAAPGTAASDAKASGAENAASGSEAIAVAPPRPDPGSSSDPNAEADNPGPSNQAASNTEDGLPDFAALLAQARAGVEESPIEEAWHSSERAELQVAFLAPAQTDQPGGLRVTPPGGSSRELHFRADGSFGASPDAAAEGRWQLWPDGSVELTIEAPGRVLRERIWFTQPNLRLRSSVEHGADGVPGRARFSSEIRRVRKPAA